MWQCDKNAHDKDHYMREKRSLYETHIVDSTYGMGCMSKGNSPLNITGT